MCLLYGNLEYEERCLTFVFEFEWNTSTFSKKSTSIRGGDISFYFSFLKFIYFNLRLITLQYCSGFGHILT